MMTKAPASWWETMSLRDEVVDASGRIEDVQMSLFNAVHGVVGKKVPYADADYFGEITFASGSLVGFMAQIAVRLGSPDAFMAAKAVWRLDQGMGGGKSHGLVALWHLAEHTTALAETDIGGLVMAEAAKIVGKGHLPADLSDPLCVVLSCDNMVPGVPDKSLDGPAGTLAERFLWRLFEGDHKKWDDYRGKLDKNKVAEAIESVGRPVLILVDEIMDWVQKATDPARDYSEIGDMSFLRDLLDTVNDVSNCAMVVVMIASDKDNITLSEQGRRAQADLEDLLTRNGTRQAVSSGGDFAEIIRRRLFDGPPPDAAVTETAKAFTGSMTGPWKKEVFDKVGWATGSEFKTALARSYPFHPSLIHLAEQEWSQHAGFQKVRSTIQIFAAAVFTHASRAERGDWAPALIGTGDLPLSSDDAREAILGSGIVADQQVVSSFREIASAEVVNADDARGTARLLDLNRDDTGWNDLNPRAAERAATAVFVYSLAPREQGRRGATEPELKAASFIPSNAYGAGDAEVVLAELRSPDSGLAALEEIAGRGGQLPRLLLSTRQTLNMFIRAQRNSITDEERDAELWDIAWGVASTGPFAKKVPVHAHDPGDAPDLRDLLERAGIDDARVNRLVVLDPGHFSLLNGIDEDSRSALRAAMGLGDHRLPVGWASSAVFVCVNTQRRANARKLTVEYLARKRVAEIEAVRSDEDLHEKAREEVKEARRQLERAIRAAYQHIVYLGEDADGNRGERSIRLDKDGHSSLDGSTVWAALQDDDKAFGVGQFDAKALLHNLRNNDWGKPLTEIRDSFWNTPRVPLLPNGDSDLAAALYQAVQAGDARLVDKDGNERAATTAADINVASPGIRLERPGGVDPGLDVEVPNLVGMDRPAARLAAETAGLVLTGEGDGIVKSQTPSAGTTAPTGSPVTATFAKSPKPTTAEHQVTITATASVTDTNRDQFRQLMTDLATALDDGDVSHIQMTLKVTVPPGPKTRLVDDAEEAGARTNVVDLT